MTGAHGVHLLGAMIALGAIALPAHRLIFAFRRQAALNLAAIYWHFMNALWIYLLALLFFAIQG